MATSKAVQLPATHNTDRNSEVRMSLKYAQEVAAEVKARRRKKLQDELAEVESLKLAFPEDVALWTDMVLALRAQIKELDEE